MLSAIARVVAARPAAKPLHPRGAVQRGTLQRAGGDKRSGVAWLDEPGVDEVLVRRSRSVGLPAPLPDVFGLALRVPTGGGGHGDLLLASTGRGPLGRFVFTPTWSPQRRALTTLIPYRTSAGPVVLAAEPRDEVTLTLSWASGTKTWHPFAELRLDDAHEPDALVSFDPVVNQVPGLETYDWVRRLREPAYVVARRARRS